MFDQATPVPIRHFLTGHIVSTAAHEGWDKLQNGDLLNAAEAAGFEVFLTTDKNIRYQQNVARRKIAIVLTRQQQRPYLKPHVQFVVAAVNGATPGSLCRSGNSPRLKSVNQPRRYYVPVKAAILFFITTCVL